MKRSILLLLCSLLLNSLTAQEINLEDQLVLHMPMDGDALDYSGNDVPTFVGGPILAEDRFGNQDRAYQFDGVDDSIHLNNSLPLITSRSFSISLWVKFLGDSQSREGSNVFFEQRDDVASSHAASSTILFDGAYFGQLVLLMRSDASRDIFKAQGNLEYDSNWHHYVARVDSLMHMEIYVDAQLHSEGNFGNEGSFINSIDHVNLGSHHHTKGIHGALNGMMDEVLIYNRAINQCEIEALYSGALSEER